MPPLVTASLIPTAAQLPPKASTSTASIAISRRNAAVLLSSILATPLLSSLVQPPLAMASTFGISGPKDWLREQKKKSAKFLLAPVDASRNILQSAYVLLTVSNEQELGAKESEQVQQLLVSASRDCIPEDRNSFVEFQSNTGVEVCTFRLIVKNASSLLDDRDPIKLEAEDKLNALIRSFAFLNGMARDAQLTANRQDVADALKDTISSLNNFEQGIKECLET